MDLRVFLFWIYDEVWGVFREGEGESYSLFLFKYWVKVSWDYVELVVVFGCKVVFR